MAGTWTEITPPGVRNWQAVASSADGMRIVAGHYGGSLWTSTNGGATWTERSNAGGRNWRSLAMSTDGLKIAAGVDGGTVYTSPDGGATWAAPTSGLPFGGVYMAVAGNADLSKITAVTLGATGGNGAVYHSFDGGATWTAGTGPFGGQLAHVASSADFSVQVIAIHTGGAPTGTQLYVTRNGGATWSRSSTPGINRVMRKAAVSADGSTMYAVTAQGDVYTSVNGSAWNSTISRPSLGPAIDLYSLAISADGGRLAVGVASTAPGEVYLSDDRASSWVLQTPPGVRHFRDIESSADGRRLIVAVGGSVANAGNLWSYYEPPLYPAQSWQSMFYGSTPVQALYLGSRQIWAKP